MARSPSQKEFEPGAGETIGFETPVTLMRGMSGHTGRLYVTNTRLVVCIAPALGLALGGVIGALAGAKSLKIAVELPIASIARLEAGKHGLAKKVIVTSDAGEAHHLVLSPKTQPDEAIAAIESLRLAST